MADEPKNQPDDIQGILSDLDDILSDLGSAAGPAHAEPAKPVAQAGPEVPVPLKPAAEVPPPGLKIELAPREGMAPVPAPAKKPEPHTAKASDAKPSLEIPSAPTPAAPAKPPPPVEIPSNTPKDQIRRVVYIHTASYVEAKDAFAAFLSSAARTISKKPIFLREVLSLEVANSSDPSAIFEKARQAKAVAVLAVTEGWTQAKSDELSEACARAGVLFRYVAPSDVQKKSTAVDVIVDMMLLPGES